MQGRYGPDALYNFLLKLYIFLLIINIFANYRILTYLELLIIIIIFYRFFSKNISQRRKENNLYLNIQKKILTNFQKIKNTFLTRKNTTNNIYKKCPSCQTTLKLPLPTQRGLKHTKCPKCQKRITLLVLRKQKVDIIKNKKKK